MFGLLGYIASFLFGFYYHYYRQNRLGKSTELCPDVSGDLEKDSDRAGELSDRAGDLADELSEVISAGDDITDIFAKYAFESEERAKLEQNPDRDSDCVPEP